MKTVGIRLRLRSIRRHSHQSAGCLSLPAAEVVTVEAAEEQDRPRSPLHPSCSLGIWVRMSIHSPPATFCHAI